MLRKSALLLSCLALSCLAVVAQMPDPTVSETQMSHYDLAAVKEGEWIEYETDAAGQKSKSRLACVKVEGDVLWIESVDMGLAAMHPGTVLLLSVNKGDRKITKAYWGKPGEVGKELPVTKADAATPEVPTTPDGKAPTMTGKASSESIKLKDTDLACEKVETTTTMDAGGQSMTVKSTTWLSEKLPFRMAMDEKAGATKKMNDMVTWTGEKAKMNGSLAKMVSESPYGAMTMVATGWGTDAKQTLKSK